jgi:serine protease inhibitor
MSTTPAPMAETLLSELLAEPKLKSSSVVFSPRNIHAALSLLALGARGPTREELLAFLGSGSEGELRAELSAAAAAEGAGGPLSSAVGLFVAAGFELRPEFVDLLRAGFMTLLRARLARPRCASGAQIREYSPLRFSLGRAIRAARDGF